MDDHQFRRVLDYLGLTWAGYRRVRKGVKKRIRRHMQELNITDMQDYIHELDRNTGEKNRCNLLMTVSISRFFRDIKLWELLNAEILPGLIKKYRKKISVWCAGCSSGEEVYSLKILWNEMISTSKDSPELAITATDINPIHLERALAGIYTASSLKDLPENFRLIYFKSQAKGRNSYLIKDSLKKGISWREHNLLFDPPISRFQVIFLRNSILTYHMDDTKKSVLKNIFQSLCPEGFLIIGAHEKLPHIMPELKLFSTLPYVFKKQS
jgi:chemotaxis methyl-accepting protein methylase